MNNPTRPRDLDDTSTITSMWVLEGSKLTEAQRQEVLDLGLRECLEPVYDVRWGYGASYYLFDIRSSDDLTLFSQQLLGTAKSAEIKREVGRLYDAVDARLAALGPED